MAEWSWPGGESRDPKIRVVDLDEFAAMLAARGPHRHAPHRIPTAHDYDLQAHAPWGHTTGQHVLDGSPSSEVEAEIRKRIAEQVVELLDTNSTDEKRTEALVWLAVNDPARGFAMLSNLVTHAWNTAEVQMGEAPGATVAALRKSLEEDE
jgi:hypothetical protein